MSRAWMRSCSVPRALTTTIGVPIPSARASSISRHPSTRGSIRSTTQTSGRSNRRRASPASPCSTQTGSKPAAVRWLAMPWAMTSSSSTIRTFAILVTIMKRLFGAAKTDLEEQNRALRVEAERARILIEESRENVVVVDADLRVMAASRRARESIEGLEPGETLTIELLAGKHGEEPVVVPYEVDGRREALVYVGEPGDLAAYEELRAGFTAAVSHELRTPLARLLALLETYLLPGAETQELVEQSRVEVEQMRELIDDVLFLSELETGRATVSLGTTAPGPVIDDVLRRLVDTAARAGIEARGEAEEGVGVPPPPRVVRMGVGELA